MTLIAGSLSYSELNFVCEVSIDFSERDWDGIMLQTTLQCGI